MSAETIVSGRAVMLAGETSAEVTLPVPTSRDGEFLVTAVHVGPEVLIGDTAADLVRLTAWAVSVPVFQYDSQGGAVQVALTATSAGIAAAQAWIPGGQTPLKGVADALVVSIVLLGGDVASARFEFNVHISGRFGSPYEIPA